MEIIGMLKSLNKKGFGKITRAWTGPAGYRISSFLMLKNRILSAIIKYLMIPEKERTESRFYRT